VIKEHHATTSNMRDMCLCIAEPKCSNTTCTRQRASSDMFVSMSNFAPSCLDYVPVEKDLGHS
jgi:hypothetical protein